MDELVKQIAAKTGISEEQARTAVQTLSAFLKEKLPAPIASQIDAVLAGPIPDAADIGRTVGGLFGH